MACVIEPGSYEPGWKAFACAGTGSGSVHSTVTFGFTGDVIHWAKTARIIVP
ncbi:hypothetical protein KKF34_11050 [Myxococcota bacterium]|nr:hypothetical protein [Myxococcota bacterium]MBU1379913.1 hypothetical protein [Myxococcota bacterium]MBU1497402.1 hypothetical protein [Myxococcota bacterium]